MFGKSGEVPHTEFCARGACAECDSDTRHAPVRVQGETLVRGGGWTDEQWRAFVAGNGGPGVGRTAGAVRRR